MNVILELIRAKEQGKMASKKFQQQHERSLSKKVNSQE